MVKLVGSYDNYPSFCITRHACHHWDCFILGKKTTSLLFKNVTRTFKKKMLQICYSRNLEYSGKVACLYYLNEQRENKISFASLMIQTYFINIKANLLDNLKLKLFFKINWKLTIEHLDTIQHLSFQINPEPISLGLN